MTKSFSHTCIAVVVIAVVATFCFSTSAAEQKTATEAPKVDFKGKIVVVVVNQSNALQKKEDTEFLVDAAVQKIGDRYFITGDAYSPPGQESHWRAGSQLGVAWERVEMFYAFTPEKFKNYEKKLQESESSEDK